MWRQMYQMKMVPPPPALKKFAVKLISNNEPIDEMNNNVPTNQLH
jgi:hypothetical protein